MGLIPHRVIFKAPSPSNQGKFFLMKSMFIVDGHNVPRSGRCDNLTYSVELPTFGTKYEDEGIYMGAYSPYLNMTLSTHHSCRHDIFLDVSPLFCFLFIRWSTPGNDGRVFHAPEIQEGEYPGALWGALSIAELFKNIREWAFMVEEPFNSDHPMATYSKLVLDTLLPPKEVLDEIDGMPDMHLARFLKGDENHRDYVEDFPQMSENMIAWFKTKLEEFPRKSTAEYLEEIII